MVIRRMKEISCKNSMDEWVVLGIAASIFLSIYVTVAMMVVTAAYLIRKDKILDVAMYTPGIKYLWTLCALGLAAAIVNNNDIGALITVALAGGFLIGAYARTVMTRALFDKVIMVACAGSLVAFVVALIQYLAFDGSLNRVSSVFINANYYAAVVEIVVLFAVYKLHRAKSLSEVGFYTAVIAMNAAGMYFSGCRTALFALFAGVALMLLCYNRYKALAAFAGLCVLLAAGMTFLPGVFPRMDQLGNDMGTRLAIWHKALEEIASHPVFGEGALAFSNFRFVVNGLRIIHAHNIYLETILCFGITGSALILVYLKKNLTPIWRMRRSNADGDRFGLALGLLSSVALHGLVDSTPFNVQTGVLVMLVLSMAGIQENLQPVLTRLPAYHTAYIHSTSAQGRKDVYAEKDRAYFTKKSA